jgi:hypothetical protein
VIVPTALVAIASVTLILVGTNLSPSANAVVALVVFGGMLGAFFSGSGWPTREAGSTDEAIAGDETEL